MKNDITQNAWATALGKAALVLGISCRLQAQQLTDNFADRQTLGDAVASFSGQNTTATPEVGEQSHGGPNAGAQHSIWGAWKAPDNGTVTMTTKGSSFDTVLAVYVGDNVEHLTPVAQNDNVESGFTWSLVSFPTKAGVVYSFAVDGRQAYEKGAAQINIQFTLPDQPQPGAEVGTDLFANRAVLPGSQAIGVADSRLASTELDEKNYYGGHTVWWRWVAPVNGLVTIDTLGSDFDTILTVYVGSSIDTMTEIQVNDDAPNVGQSRLAFQTLAGQEYQLMVDGRHPFDLGNLILHLALTNNFAPGAVAGADVFANRGRLEGINALGVANNRLFGLDAGESGSHGRHTSWWQWTAPANGLVEIMTQGSDFDTYLSVYTGASVTSLQLIADNDNYPNGSWSKVQFQAQRGVPYQILVDGTHAYDVGNIAVAVNQRVPLPDTLAIYPAVEVEIPGNEGVIYKLQASADLIRWEDTPGVSEIAGHGFPIRILIPTRGTDYRAYRCVKR